MNESIKQELYEHTLDLVKGGGLTVENVDEWHNIAFNTDYWVIGYHQCEEWLESHGVSAWDAIDYVVDKELELFGEFQLKHEDINAETIVNKVVYFAAEELLSEKQDELEETCKVVMTKLCD